MSEASYLWHLDKYGYCVVANVLSDEEVEIYKNRLWTEYVEKAFPPVKYNDKSTWKDHFPIHNHLGIFCGPVGQTQLLWDIRQNSRVVEPFSKLWNVPQSDLIVSMDGISLMCPPELRENPNLHKFEPWPHVDQFRTIGVKSICIKFQSMDCTRTNSFGRLG